MERGYVHARHVRGGRPPRASAKATGAAPAVLVWKEGSSRNPHGWNTSEHLHASRPRPLPKNRKM